MLRTDLRLTLSQSSGLETSAVCAEIAEQYSPLSQHARSLLSPLMVLAFPIKWRHADQHSLRHNMETDMACEIRDELIETNLVSCNLYLQSRRTRCPLEASVSFISFCPVHALLPTRTWLTICTLKYSQTGQHCELCTS